MPRQVSIRRSLLTNLVLVVALLAGTIAVVRFVGTQRALRSVSEALIEQALERIDLKLEGFFSPVHRQLEMILDWGEEGFLDWEDPELLDRLLVPALRSHPWIYSVGVADSSGREHRIFRTPEGWLSRQLFRDEWGEEARSWAWQDGAADRVEATESTDYDPRGRPWFQGAQDLGEGAAGGGPTVYWTEPYVFFATQAPGISASMGGDGPDGRFVVSLDLLLADISRFTSTLVIEDEGRAFVMTEDRRMVGLPRNPVLENAGPGEFLLRRPEEIGTQLAQDAAEALLAPGHPAGDPIRFGSGGEPWWGEVSRFQLPGSDRVLLSGVAVPEHDLLDELGQQRLWIGILSLLAVVLAVVRAVVVAGRYSRPIEQLVDESNRIGAGDLEPGEPILSSVKEVRSLAEAHDRMRVSLGTLLKMERELQIAQEIQQKTFPADLPAVDRYDLAAWNQPADETGGDSYDVIGFHLEAEQVVLSSEEVSRIAFLLADATGHGIGPALSVTQLRAMMRIGLRLSARLPELVTNMNEQLCADLPSGRFITAWFAVLDPGADRLTTFSAGQAPLLLYRAAEDDFEVFAADAMPLGLFAGLPLNPPVSLSLAPGDLYAAISDGIFEASRAEEEFGLERVQEILRRHCRSSCDEIVEALREAVESFTDGAPPDDDRTILLIRRSD